MNKEFYDEIKKILAIARNKVYQTANASDETIYQSKLYQITENMIIQGQKEGSVVDDTPMKLADYFWGVVYLYSLRKLFTMKYELISVEDLARILLKDEV